jgi:hypothetical protein
MTATHHRSHLSPFARLLTLLSILLFSAGSLAPANASPAASGWTLIGQVGGSTQAVAVQGAIAYTGVGLKLTVLDASNPAHPVLLGESAPLGDNIQDIALSGDLACLAAGNAGLVLVDISDPSALAILGRLDTRGYAEGIAVSGSTIFLADGPYGLRVVDATDPGNPHEIGSAYDFNYAFDVAVSGAYAYVAAGGSGLLVVNVSDPAAPVEVRAFDTPGYVYSVALAGQMAYLADAWAGVKLVNISNPAAPFLAGSAPTPGWALSLAVSGSSLYVANGVNGLRILNVANSASPYEVGAWETDGFQLRLAVEGSRVYLADTLNGLHLVDAAAPAAPVETALFSQMSDARRVVVADGYAYVAAGDEGHLYIFDISDPHAPSQAARFDGGGYAGGVAVSGSFAYLATFMDSPNYLWVVNLSDPAHPTQAAVVPLDSLDPANGAAREVVIQGTDAYIADEYGLRIYDISTPAGIHITGQIDLNLDGTQTTGVAVSGDYAFVADATDGVRVVDISDPAAPGLVHTFHTGSFTEAVAVAGDRLYAANSGAGIQVLDISNPLAIPAALGSYATPGGTVGVTIAGTELFTSQGLGGVQVLDVSNPAAITPTALLEPPGYAWHTAYADDLLYVADGAGGLLIYQREAGGSPARQPATPGPANRTPQAATSPSASALPNQAVEPQAGHQAASLALPPAGARAPAAGTCTVTSTADSGAGSLRECLAPEHATPGTTITFDTGVFPPASPATIHVLSLLPELNAGSLTLDASNAGVILDGGGTVANGIQIGSSHNQVMGLQVRNFSGNGIRIGFPSQYNQVGGDHMVGNGPSGQGNVVNGSAVGIFAGWCSHNVIVGNFVGTNAGGTAAGGLNHFGIGIGNDATHTQIGGLTPGERNILSGNDIGIDIADHSAQWNRIIGNFIGTDISGSYAIPNLFNGVVIEVGARNNTVGGTTPAERNLISGNAGTAVVLTDAPSFQNTVIGNYIGVDASGMAALPNKAGISIFTTAFNRIGGSQPGEGNLISGNLEKGIEIASLGRSDAIVIGNRIGVDAGGAPALGNTFSGVNIQFGRHVFIGGLGPGEGNQVAGNGLGYGVGVSVGKSGSINNWVAGNVISNNAYMGVSIQDYASRTVVVRNTITSSSPGVWIRQGTLNTLRANSIFDNASAGIQLLDGGNQMLAAPVITGLTPAGVSGTACADCLVEVFSDVGSQGRRYEGAVWADGSGNFSLAGIIFGVNVTATATDGQGNTSSFSAPVGTSWSWFVTNLPLIMR